MRISIWLALIAAVIVVGLVMVAGQALIQPDVPLITDAAFGVDTITPNADGHDDVVIFSYSISRNATVTLQFEHEDGRAFTFRDHQARASGDYQVAFSGVVGGFTLPGESIVGEVLRRLVPNGRYTWHLTAEGLEHDETDARNGTLIVADGDSPLPEMPIFEVSPSVFTPNQDGVYDRAAINVYLEKDAQLTVYLVNDAGDKYYISEREEGRKLGEAGRHYLDYEGGVDLGADPPPDGVYSIVAEAQDEEGQIIRRTASLTIKDGGQPLAEIVPQVVGVDVVFDVMPYDDRYFSTAEALGDFVALPDDPASLDFVPVTIPLGDMLVFKLTVENYGDVPVRTSGPPPGTVYQQDQIAAALGEFDQSGAWRIGIQCETSSGNYPWRWAIGSVDNLVTEYDAATDNTYYYLPAGARSVIWGGIRMTDLRESRNPQNCWAGLIHEDVEISNVNNMVGTRGVELVDPNASAVDD